MYSYFLKNVLLQGGVEIIRLHKSSLPILHDAIERQQTNTYINCFFHRKPRIFNAARTMDLKSKYIKIKLGEDYKKEGVIAITDLIQLYDKMSEADDEELFNIELKETQQFISTNNLKLFNLKRDILILPESMQQDATFYYNDEHSPIVNQFLDFIHNYIYPMTSWSLPLNDLYDTSKMLIKRISNLDIKKIKYDDIINKLTEQDLSELYINESNYFTREDEFFPTKILKVLFEKNNNNDYTFIYPNIIKNKLNVKFSLNDIPIIDDVDPYEHKILYTQSNLSSSKLHKIASLCILLFTYHLFKFKAYQNSIRDFIVYSPIFYNMFDDDDQNLYINLLPSVAFTKLSSAQKLTNYKYPFIAKYKLPIGLQMIKMAHLKGGKFLLPPLKRFNLQRIYSRYIKIKLGDEKDVMFDSYIDKSKEHEEYMRLNPNVDTTTLLNRFHVFDIHEFSEIIPLINYNPCQKHTLFQFKKQPVKRSRYVRQDQIQSVLSNEPKNEMISEKVVKTINEYLLDIDNNTMNLDKLSYILGHMPSLININKIQLYIQENPEMFLDIILNNYKTLNNYLNDHKQILLQIMNDSLLNVFYENQYTKYRDFKSIFEDFFEEDEAFEIFDKELKEIEDLTLENETEIEYEVESN